MEWISVNDWLPPQSVHVLATNGKFIIVAESVFLETWKLQSIICTCCDYEYSDELTHWMPLPKLPKN